MEYDRVEPTTTRDNLLPLLPLILFFSNISSQCQNLKASHKFPHIFVHLLKQTLLDIIKYFRGYIQQPMLKGSDENRMKIQTSYLEILLRETRKKESSQTTFLLLCCLAVTPVSHTRMSQSSNYCYYYQICYLFCCYLLLLPILLLLPDKEF